MRRQLQKQRVTIRAIGQGGTKRIIVRVFAACRGFVWRKHRSISPALRGGNGDVTKRMSPSIGQTENGQRTDEKKGDWMRRFRRVPRPSRDVRQRNALEIGGALTHRRKFLIYRHLCRQLRPIPGPVDPDESGCRIASGCLIIDRDVSRSSAASPRPGRTTASSWTCFLIRTTNPLMAT